MINEFHLNFSIIFSSTHASSHTVREVSVAIIGYIISFCHLHSAYFFVFDTKSSVHRLAVVTMSSKSISTGTLSLRFMQNAHRAKQLKEVELDRAEVKDDGMWEVSQAVRDAWGLQRAPDSSLVYSFQL